MQAQTSPAHFQPNYIAGCTNIGANAIAEYQQRN
jgi:hypothetical protein